MADPHTLPAPPSAERAGRIAELALSRERFLGFLRRQTGDDTLAEEILQTGFARALERADSLEDEDSAPAWFYRLLRNAVIDHFRRRSAEHHALEVLSVEPLCPPELPDARLLADVCRCLLPLLDSLPENYAEILRAVDIGESSPKEFALAHGISRNTAAVRLHRARQALLDRARQCCGTGPGAQCGCGGFAAHRACG